MTTYAKNLQTLQTAFTRKIGYTIHNSETAIEVLERYTESKTNLINKIFIDNGILNAKITFKQLKTN